MRLRVVGIALLLLAVLAFPAAFGRYPVKLLQEILIWGIYAMSLDLLMGYAGMVSFGHSAFFGVGGYVAALALTAHPGPVGALLLPALASGLAALVIGFFSTRVSGVYFIMLTLAFSQMLYAYAFQNPWLGAEDGINGVPRPAILGVALGEGWAFHVYVVAVAAAAGLFLWRVVRSPFGHVLIGIHENEGRMEAVGYPVRRYKLLAFVLGGTLAGLAGSLYAQFSGSITPDALFWKTSGEALLMVILGGTGTLGGAVLGAAAFILLQSLVSTYTERWMLILGATFVLFVLFAPGGIVGALRGRIGTPRVTAAAALSRSTGSSGRFGALTAVNGVTLSVAPRERRAIIGPNGAGKTTLFNLITGHLAPTAGRILFEGAPIAGLPPYARARRGISRSFQRTNVFPRLPVLENLRLAAAARGRGNYDLLGSVDRLWVPIERARSAAEAVGLTDRLDAPAGALSYGEQRQLEIGIALATDPKLLLLDEPTAGMSPEETLRMTELLAGLPRAITLLIIEHDMDVVFTLADRITVLHHGEVLAEGTAAEVRADPRVYDVYLGVRP